VDAEEPRVEAQAEDDLRERREERQERQVAVVRGRQERREERDEQQAEDVRQDVRETVERRLSGQPADLRDEGRD
jgi:hypothetical protein